MTTGHPHATLMAEYAEVAKTNPRPWEEFEYRTPNDQTWFTCDCSPGWISTNLYRRKPKPKQTTKYYQWVIHATEYAAFPIHISPTLYLEGETPRRGIQRIEPGYNIEVTL